MMRWWLERDGRRIDIAVQAVGGRFHVAVDGARHEVELVAVNDSLSALLLSDGRAFAVASRRETHGHWRISVGDRDFQVKLRDPLERELAGRGPSASGPQEIRAPIPGKVVSVAVAAGDAVSAGQVVVVLEAMKMENQICAEGAGTVETVVVEPGAAVDGGQVLVVLS
jgi:biotin carboxyl carrier protein